MTVIAVCVLLVVVAIVMVVKWSALPDRREPPPAPRENGLAGHGLHLVGGVAIGSVAGLVAGALAAGAGGRLVMRLLALTSPDARGQITEADAIVGSITAGGTASLIAFCAFLGVPTGWLYMILRRLLPAGRAGGVAFGALLLILAGTRLEPVRPDNFDFDLVGPAWLALLGLGAVVLLHGMLVAAVAERTCVAVPWLAPRTAPGGLHPARVVTAGRIALGVGLLVALPGFVAATAEIV